MKKYLLLFVLLLTGGCTFQVNVLEPQSTNTVLPASPTAIPHSTPTPALITPTFAETPTSLPTATPSPLPPVTSAPANSSSVVPIVFAPNATSEMIVGNLDAGASQAYSLTAFEGQVMSVSILPESLEQQNTLQMEIKRSNGTILCPVKNYGCSFWRGALPATGEYQIKVRAQQGGAYSMRVAINPPGKVNQTFSYADPGGRFTISYPDDFAPAHYTGAQVTKIPPDFSLQYIDTQQYISTNLGEVYFLLDVSHDPQQVSACTQPLNFEQPETILGDTTINGINFTKSQGGGVAAGNVYEQIYYRTVYNDSCYEITYFIHYANIGNYTPGTVTEFDRTALYQELDEILASLILK